MALLAHPLIIWGMVPADPRRLHQLLLALEDSSATRGGTEWPITLADLRIVEPSEKSDPPGTELSWNSMRGLRGATAAS